jgi:hypothetical protein
MLSRNSTQLSVEILKSPFVPWKEYPWLVSPEEFLTPEFGSFIGPLVYLSVSYDEPIKDQQLQST